mmetsp:Transcript_11708/g.30517  ORF Transcript_11708/g.30517 Transcript_11708/m.30517 type:complete len:156 (-) Transcript_11708:244-711(-)
MPLSMPQPAPSKSEEEKPAAVPATPKEMPTTKEMITMPANTFAIPAIALARARWDAGGGSQRLMSILRTQDNLRALRKLVVGTGAMVVMPMAVMFVCHVFLLDLFFTIRNPSQRVVYSGIAGLCAVQVVMVWFVVSAFREDAAESAPAAERPHAD